MADPQRVELRTVAHDAERVVVTAHGAVDRATSARLLDDLVKLLVDGVPVLLDVSELTLVWAPAPEVFVAAVTSAGGWPYARLVLFDADAPTAERLRSCRVPDAVFLAGTLEQAAALVDVRPAWLSRGIDLPGPTGLDPPRPRVPPRHRRPMGSARSRQRRVGRHRAGDQRRGAHGQRVAAAPRPRQQRSAGVGP